MHATIDTIIASRPATFRLQAARTYKTYNREERLSLIAAIERMKTDQVGIIAEIKKSSPSHGPFSSTNVVELARAYDAAGVQGISVLTEPSHFNGSFDDLQSVVNRTTVPVLCKDFVITRKQLELANQLGASAVLIIVKIRSSLSLIGACLDLGMEPLLEIHDQEDLDIIVPIVKNDPRLRLVGINNRDLATMEIDLDTSDRLIPAAREALGDDAIIISESGIETASDVQRLVSAGADAMLIGTMFMERPVQDVGATIKDVQAACKRGV
jgi:indole-3-glycerol phosphate synthase